MENQQEQPKPQAMGKDPAVQKALDNKKKQSPEVQSLIDEWQTKVNELVEVQRQVQLFQQQINRLQMEFQKGIGIVGGIEISIKSFLNAMPKKTKKSKKEKKK